MTAQVNYTDINSNGVDTVLSAQQDIITNTGTVSLNNTSYDTGDAVTITLVDPDLDRDTSTADVYNVFQDSTDPDRDLVGKNAQGSQETLLSGRSLGMLLEVTLNNTRWQSGTCTLSSGTPNGLGGTTFALQETGPNTGTFTGTFDVPAQFCDGADTVYTNGTNIGVTYLDFRNATGSIVTASDTASIAAAVTTPTPPVTPPPITIPNNLLTIPPLTNSSSSAGMNFDSDTEHDGSIYYDGDSKRYTDDSGNDATADLYVARGTETLPRALFEGTGDYQCTGNFERVKFLGKQRVPSFAIPDNVTPDRKGRLAAYGLDFYNKSTTISCRPNPEAVSDQTLITDTALRITIYGKADKKPIYFSPRDGILKAQPIPMCTTDMIDTSNNNALKGNNTVCYGVHGNDMVIVTKRLTGFYGAADSVTTPTDPTDLNAAIPVASLTNPVTGKIQTHEYYTEKINSTSLIEYPNPVFLYNTLPLCEDSVRGTYHTIQMTTKGDILFKYALNGVQFDGRLFLTLTDHTPKKTISLDSNFVQQRGNWYNYNSTLPKSILDQFGNFTSINARLFVTNDTIPNKNIFSNSSTGSPLYYKSQKKAIMELPDAADTVTFVPGKVPGVRGNVHVPQGDTVPLTAEILCQFGHIQPSPSAQVFDLGISADNATNGLEIKYEFTSKTFYQGAEEQKPTKFFWIATDSDGNSVNGDTTRTITNSYNFVIPQSTSGTYDIVIYGSDAERTLIGTHAGSYTFAAASAPVTNPPSTSGILTIPKPDNLEISTDYDLQTITTTNGDRQTTFMVRDEANEKYVFTPVAFENELNGKVGDVYIPARTLTESNPIFFNSVTNSYANTDCDVDVWSITELAKTNNIPSFTIPANINTTNPNSIVGLALDFGPVGGSCAVDMDAKSPNPIFTEKEMRFTIYDTTNQPYYFSPRDDITTAVQIPACTTDMINLNDQSLKGDTKMCYGKNGDDIVIITKRIAFYAVAGVPRDSTPTKVIDPTLLTIPPLGSLTPTFGTIEFKSDPANDGQLYQSATVRSSDSDQKYDIYMQLDTRTLVTRLFTGVDDYSCSARVDNVPRLIDNNHVPNLAIPNNISPKDPDSVVAAGLDFYIDDQKSPCPSPDIEEKNDQPLITDKDMRITIYNNIDKKPYYFSPRDGITEAQPIPKCTSDIVDINNNHALKRNNVMCYGVNGTGDTASIVIVTKRLTGFYGVATSIDEPTNPMKFQYGGATVPLVDKSTLLSIPSIGSSTPSFKIMEFKSDPNNDGQIYHEQDTARYSNSDKKYDIYMEQNARTLVTSLFTGVDDFSCSARVSHIPGLITDNRVPNLAAPANIQPRLVSSLDAVGLDFYNATGSSSCLPNIETPSKQPLVLDKDMRITLPDTGNNLYYFSPRDGITEAQPIPACTSDIIDTDNNNALKDGNTMCYGVNATTGPQSFVVITKCLTGFYGTTDTLFVPTRSVNPNNMCGSGDPKDSDDYLATAPTFGVSQLTGEQLVTCGYKMDDTCRDITGYHVQYERDTIQTNTTHTFAIKTLAPNMLHNVILAFSVPNVGAPVSTAEAYISVHLGINYSEPSHHYITDVTIHDPNNIIDYDTQNTTVSAASCSGTELQCTQITLPDVLFREVMNHEPFAIQVTDTLRFTSINYMNEGVFVEGTSLNAPPTAQPGLTLSSDDGRPVTLILVRTDKVSDLWADAFGNTWSRNSFGNFVIVEYAPYAGTTPVCTDINDRICAPFKAKLDWHNQRMIELRDSLYDAYKTKAYAEIDNIFTYEFGDVDSRTRTLINLGWLTE